MFWHPETQKYYNAIEAQKKLKIAGVSAQNCESVGLFVPTTATRPTLTSAQTARKDSTPTLTNGVWVTGWTVEDIPAETRISQAAEECSRRIYAVADATAQMNMASRASAGLMSADQMTAWRSSLAWVGQMRGTWRDLAADTTKDISDDANWPECPADVVALADLF